ncbi:MAG: hypothetical protein JWQ44_2948 [Chthoniobacter sp.]|nr:hypothetical protein [Chthoniobacter sp.]
MDLDAYEERAAIAEFDGGLTRFQAETLAAKAQGLKRWEVMDAIKSRDTEQASHRGEAAKRDGADAVSRVQPPATEENATLPVGDLQAGRDSGALPSLRLENGGVL